MKLTVLVLLADSVLSDVTRKAGLSFVDSTCDDAKALGLEDSWYYNWNSDPNAKGPGCPNARSAEFVPMLWGCTPEHCGDKLPEDYWSTWLKTGVRHLLGFNEPDNVNQANMTPADAALAWVKVQEIANKFDPPLELVSPAMTHWSMDGTPWLDEFFGNCSSVSGCDPSLIKYVAFHDYSGNPDTIINNANGVAKKYGRKVWLTEFSVGSGEHRTTQDSFLKEIVPRLEGADAVFRYAWYSTRNRPDTWVAESSLLPYYLDPWHKQSKRSCDESELTWLSGKSWQPGSLAQCGAKAVDSDACAKPLTIVYENGGANNCYCANTTCTDKTGDWQDRYIYTPPSYNTFPKKVCTSEDDMLWLTNGDDSSLEGCQALAELTGLCAHPKTVAFESGGNHNCYCAKSSTCQKVTSDWLSLHVQHGGENATSVHLTSTGNLYKLHAASTVVI